MNTLYVFTEEKSCANVMNAILPKLVPKSFRYKIHHFSGCEDLEKALECTLPKISEKPNAKILILRDQDNQKCKILKAELNELIVNTCKCPYKIRIVCTELESWFLGDMLAVSKAYTRFEPKNFSNKAKYRNVDKIVKPNKDLLKIIPEMKGYKNLPKLEVSERIAPFLDLAVNKSESFQHTIKAIRNLVE